ncbi:MAG: peroxiredoxin [Bacteroidota bacterium]
MNLQTTSMPRIGDMAPDFEANTTWGKLKFSDYGKGSWVIFFSHPADFTPVCTTELSRFALEEERFNKLNAKVIGLSIDSIHSHVAWVSNIKKNMGISIKYPMIADVDFKVANLYGMLQPNESETATVRAVFIIDPTGKIRLIVYYPMNVGRNVDEIYRTLLALQTSDEHKVSCPVNWQPGEKVIVPPPKTLAELEIRENSGLEQVDFYLAKRSL